MRTSRNTTVESGPNIQELSETLSAIREPATIERLLRALLTEAEVNEIAGRWQLVKLLQGGMSQRRIAETLHMSLCKITRGSKELKKPGSALKQAVLPYIKESDNGSTLRSSTG